jgi:tRNA U34 5-carboxymethylaminomethyl modifying enzyme MnmG/GidA
MSVQVPKLLICIIFSAFDLLSGSSVQTKISQLRQLMPEELKCLDGTESVWPRVQIASVYEYFEKEQEAEVEAIRKEQALIIPRDFDYSM